MRPRVRPWSPVCVVAAIATSSMRSFGTFGLRSRSPTIALTTRSSARVFQYMPFSPARRTGCGPRRRIRLQLDQPRCSSLSIRMSSILRTPSEGAESVDGTYESAEVASSGTACDASTKASAIVCAVASTCHGRAPSAARAAPTDAASVGSAGGVPRDATQVVGREQVLDRHVDLLGDLGDGRLREPQARVGLGVARSPRRAAAAASRSAPARRAARSSARPRSIADHHRSSSDAARAPGELAQVGEGAPGRRQRLRATARIDAVGHQCAPVRCRVPTRERVAGEPQLAGDGEVAWAAHRRGCRRGGATARQPGGFASRCSTASNSWAARSALPVSTRRSTSRSRTSTRSSTSSAAYFSQDCGSGRVDQSAAECSFASLMSSSSSTTDASPTRGMPEQAGRELGVEDALGVEADLAQAREVLARRVQHPLLGAGSPPRAPRSRGSAADRRGRCRRLAGTSG